MNKLTEYKKVALDYPGVLDELMERAILQNKLMSIVYSLLNDDEYTKDHAAKGLLDVITEDLDYGFQTASDKAGWELLKENDRLQERIQALEGKVRSIPVVGTVK